MANNEAVRVPVDSELLEGSLAVPADARAVIIFAHGSGSSRHSPRNRYVAEVLQKRGFATLLFDLLTESEATDRNNVFDIPLLGSRVEAAISSIGSNADVRELPVGLFGASTGAAAALVAAAGSPDNVAAVVSRGGRPDLAGPALDRVKAPTLLIVGELDHQVIALNREAQAMLTCKNRLEIVPGASHLFEEPGTLEAAVDLASGWFTTYCSRR